MMTRAQKSEEISAISERFKKAKAAFLVDFKGMNVEEVTHLRKKLSPIESEMKVVRNTLAKLALKDHPESESALTDSLTGTNAIVFAYGDITASAKTLAEFNKEVEELVIKKGVMGGHALDENKIKYLSTLPSKEELQSKLLSVFQAPMGKLLRTFNEVPGSFVRVLNTKAESQDS